MKYRRTNLVLMWIAAAATVFGIVGITARLADLNWVDREPRFHDSFGGHGDAQSQQTGWQAFGGTWQVLDGAMLNISDDRGAKLLNGSPSWTNYIVEADIQLLAEGGDAGFVVRASEAEVGVDAYHGYFAGLRDLDDTLILGRADFGWHEVQTIPVRSGLNTRKWYHLTVLVFECSLIARSITEGGEVTTARFHDPQCLTHGRFGLQSYSTGAAWRNLEVRPATKGDMEAMLRLPSTERLNRPSTPGLIDSWSEERYFLPMQRELQNYKTDRSALPIADLRLLAPNYPSRVTVHGVVTLVSPMLFVQDSTGGVAVPHPRAGMPVQIGDSVEARGDVELHDFSSVLRNADVRLLWSHAAVPPVSVTASQAATGAFDAQFIETEGRLISKQRAGDKSFVLKFDEGSQSFMAIAENPSLAETFDRLKYGSRLRIRGICVTDPAFTRDEMPFVVLMRSAEDAQMIEPPPWWSARHLIELIVGLLTLSMSLQFFYSSFKRSRWRAVMEERERLGLEMHDTLAQSFAGVGFQLEALCDEAHPDSSMRAQLESTVSMVRAGHLEARRNIAALRPGNFDEMGLAKALEMAAHSIIQGGPVLFSTSVSGEPRPIPLRIGDTLFRIGQEAIANAVRHGHPGTIFLRIVYGRPSVKLTIRDDGRGFSLRDQTSGLGISGMRRRAASIDATFRIHSLPARGTSVHVRAVLPRTLLPIRWRAIRIRKRKRGPHGHAD
ncbi:MAG TPA: histidine kinase [Acidisarcina sp.]